MLDAKTSKKICDFVYIKPRTIQEISHLIGKNWRTADHYINRIIDQQGCLSMRTFREGTRGALKIVYWSNIEKIHSTTFQERLFAKIEAGREKSDFDPFDIYQYVDEKKRKAFLESFVDASKSKKQQLINLIRQTNHQLLCFSGNLSFVDIQEKGRKVIDVMEELAKEKKDIKILSRVDLATLRNIEKIEEVNNKIGREAIEIRHCRQPLRAFIIDTHMVRFKDEKVLRKYKFGELDKNAKIFYEIYDEEWVEWMQKVFWHLFRNSIPAQKCIKDLKSIEK